MVPVTVDIEVTNRCNADCYFCPRDQTPHEGLMSWAVFEKTLERIDEANAVHVAEFGQPLRVSLCGLGEPLLNPRIGDMVRAVKDAGYDCYMSSNGALLNQRRRTLLIEAGLDEMYINIGDIGEDYESVYHLPFEKTQDRIVAFAEESAGVTKVNIVLVDYKGDRDHLRQMVQHWKARGLDNFVFFDVMNRGGALFVEDMQFGEYPEVQQAMELLTVDGQTAICAAPVLFRFVGYDGQYYLCCSDWRKQAPFGSVFETSFLAVSEYMVDYAAKRSEVCQRCNVDPVNQLAAKMREADAGEAGQEDVATLRAGLIEGSAGVATMLRHFQTHLAGLPLEELRAAKRRIPLRIV